jgi:hypothetical protein
MAVANPNNREWTLVEFTAADSAAKVLRECLRINAEALVAWILQQEFERFLLQHRHGDEVQSVVRNGFQPPRTVTTGLGALTIRYPKARSKNGEVVLFRSQLVPKYAHRALDPSDAAEWKCLDAVQNENLTGILRAVFGDRAHQVTHVVPELAARWATRVSAWKQRSLADHSEQDLWMLTVATPACPESLDFPLHVVIAVNEGGAKRILGVAPCRVDSPVDAWGGLIESIQGRGLKSPARIYSNWQAPLLSDGLRRLAPEWAKRVVVDETTRVVQLKDSVSARGWDWPAAIHQN